MQAGTDREATVHTDCIAQTTTSKKRQQLGQSQGESHVLNAPNEKPEESQNILSREPFLVSNYYITEPRDSLNKSGTKNNDLDYVSDDKSAIDRWNASKRARTLVFSESHSKNIYIFWHTSVFSDNICSWMRSVSNCFMLHTTSFPQWVILFSQSEALYLGQKSAKGPENNLFENIAQNFKDCGPDQ